MQQWSTGRFYLDFLTTFEARPIGCPVSWGGAGPDYPDTQPILFKSLAGIGWTSQPQQKSSSGNAKVKQGPIDNQWRLVLNITEGKYRPPPGIKTKIKFRASFHPFEAVYSCADDSDPLTDLKITSDGPVVVSQK